MYWKIHLHLTSMTKIVVEGVAFGVIGDAFAQKFKDNWAKTDVEKIYDQIKGCK